MERRIIKIFFFIAILFSSTIAQTDSVQASADTTQQKFVMQKSPLGAVLRSAIIPGWGQLYNRSYWKAPIVWGFVGYYLYYWIKNNNKYIDWGDLYTKSLRETKDGNSNYITSRDIYHDQRDLFAIYIAITYFLNLMDAYVDAHLFDFDIKDEPFGQTARMNLKIRF
ncbi:MAG: DUF5683 domain-containing protein [Ignavibacteriales bacterium]|nr:DUF5683 domain-containing protein [Ignavibacteriales bacterium]